MNVLVFDSSLIRLSNVITFEQQLVHVNPTMLKSEKALILGAFTIDLESIVSILSMVQVMPQV